MSKKKIQRQIQREIDIADAKAILKIHNRQRQEAVGLWKFLKDVQALRQKHATAIIGGGLVSDSGPVWEDVLYTLCEERTAKERHEIEADLDKGIGNVDPSSRITSIATEWGDLGFMLGLAVGMQLGPSALDEGGAK